MDRNKVDAILATRKLSVGKDSSRLDHLASLLLEGSYTDEHGILPPNRRYYPGLPSVKVTRRLRENTYDPTEGIVREVSNTLSTEGEVEIDEEQEEE